MKTKSIIFLSVFPLLSIAQNKNCKVVIKAINNNVNTKTYLVTSFGMTNEKYLDSSFLQNGTAVFNRKIEDPQLITLVINHQTDQVDQKMKNKDYLNFYLENGTVKITYTDSLKNATIEGAAINNEYTLYKKEVLDGPLNDYSTLRAYVIASSDSLRKDLSYQKDLVERMHKISMKLDSLNRIFITEHPNYYVSLTALNQIAGKLLDYEKINQMFIKLSEDVRQTELGKDLAARLKNASGLASGDLAPEFTETDTNGVPVKLSSFKGKYVLIDFWASWCGPCRAENPNIVKAFQQCKDKNFTIIGVSLDNKKDAWLAAIKKDGLEWTQVSGLNGWKDPVAQLYKILFIPQNILINPNGKIVGRNLKGEDLSNTLKKLFISN